MTNENEEKQTKTIMKKIKKTSLNFPAETYNLLKLQALLEGKTVSELLDDLLVDYLQKKRKEAMIA